MRADEDGIPTLGSLIRSLCVVVLSAAIQIGGWTLALIKGWQVVDGRLAVESWLWVLGVGFGSVVLGKAVLKLDDTESDDQDEPRG